MCRQQHVVTIKISKRDIGGVALLGVCEQVLRRLLRNCQFHDLPEGNSLPLIIEAAPARHTMEVACNRDPRKAAEVFPRKLDRILYQTKDTKIPTRRFETRNRSLVQNRPFQGERLPGRQTSFLPHLLLFFFALIAGEDSRNGHTFILATFRSKPSTPDQEFKDRDHCRRARVLPL